MVDDVTLAFGFLLTGGRASNRSSLPNKSTCFLLTGGDGFVDGKSPNRSSLGIGAVVVVVGVVEVGVALEPGLLEGGLLAAPLERV